MDPDLVIVGAGTAGMPCAIEAAAGGARVMVIDKADRVGGTLHVSGGHLTGAGTRRQRERGLHDDPDAHFADVMRIGHDLADRAVLRRAVELGPGLIDWLDDLGFEQADASPRIVHGHEPYSVARTHHGTDEARSILRLLLPLWDTAVASGRVELRLETSVTGLVTDEGAVTGVTTIDAGGATETIGARAVVLATGGYASNTDLFTELESTSPWSAAPPTSTGDGLRLARDVGAAINGAGRHLPTFGGLPDPEDPTRTLWMPRLHLVAVERPPWELYVDRHGRRFVAEDEPSIDAKERALRREVPGLTFHVVIDARGLRESHPVLVGTDRSLDELAGTEGFVRADSIGELADAAGIDASGLAETVAAYNADLAAGRPDRLGRSHRPAPVDEPPFWAIRNHGSTVITFAGLAVDADFAVLDTDRRPIAGLHAIGEVQGAAATMGDAFCGGMTLTPALAFGRDLGARLGAALS